MDTGFDRHGEFSFGNGLIILSFFNSYLEKPKSLNNVQLLKELPFYDEVSIVKNKTAKPEVIKLKLLIKEM